MLGLLGKSKRFHCIGVRRMLTTLTFFTQFRSCDDLGGYPIVQFVTHNWSHGSMYKQNNCNHPNESSHDLNWVATNTLAKYVYCPVIEQNLERLEKQRPLDQIHTRNKLTIEACASDSQQLFLKKWLREIPIKALSKLPKKYDHSGRKRVRCSSPIWENAWHS